MTTATVTGETLAGPADLPLLVCGPGTDTTARELWSGVADRLGDHFHVVTWELSGPGGEPDRADLVVSVVEYLDRVCADRGEPRGEFHYAGCGDRGLDLALLGCVPERVASVVLGGTPEEVAAAHLGRADAPGAGPTTPATVEDRRRAGMEVRREVLGGAHVDRATAAATDLTREFQQFITDYAWGGIWTRPGLGRRSRSMITLTALVARGHHEELAMHLRAARTNGVAIDEIKELLLQTAIYCGVPDANTAFRIAQKVLETPEE